MAVFKSKFAGGQHKSAGVAQRTIKGMDWLYFQVAIPSEAVDSSDEQVLLYKFPDDGDCWLFQGGNSLDTDAAVPALGSDFMVTLSAFGANTVFTLGIGDVDGVGLVLGLVEVPVLVDVRLAPGVLADSEVDALAHRPFPGVAAVEAAVDPAASERVAVLLAGNGYVDHHAPGVGLVETRRVRPLVQDAGVQEQPGLERLENRLMN